MLLYGSAVPSASAGPRFVSYPFTLGVASGEPSPDGIVLWTRLAPDPLNGGGLGEETYRVRFEVAKDPGFRHLVHRGHTRVGPEEVHTVHAEVDGPEAGARLLVPLRVEARDQPGRTFPHRAPVRHGAQTPEVRLRLLPDVTHGYFSPFHDLAQQSDVELVVHLGDYIYERTRRWWRPPGARAGDLLMTLADYRTRHAQYKTDESLQAVHPAFPWVLTWDDHEFWQNYADLDLDSGPVQPLETIAERRAAAYLAYWEHNPLPRSRKPVGQNLPMYRRGPWGDSCSSTCSTRASTARTRSALRGRARPPAATARPPRPRAPHPRP